MFSLEIEFGFQHRGVERQLIGGPDRRTLHLMETVAGDTTIGHATAYCQLVEGLAGAKAPLRAHAVCAIAMELERLANHTGDLGALAQDVGYLPTASFCGRIRGDWLNTTALICGNRFGRSLVRPGGVRFDIDEPIIEEVGTRHVGALRDVTGAATAVEHADGDGRVQGLPWSPRSVANDLGLVGMAAAPAGSIAMRGVIFPMASIVFTRFRFPPGTRAMCSPARTSVGLRSSVGQFYPGTTSFHARYRPAT